MNSNAREKGALLALITSMSASSRLICVMNGYTSILVIGPRGANGGKKHTDRAINFGSTSQLGLLIFINYDFFGESRRTNKTKSTPGTTCTQRSLIFRLFFLRVTSSGPTSGKGERERKVKIIMLMSVAQCTRWKCREIRG